MTKKISKNSPIVSDCCAAEITVQGKEPTFFHRCEKCLRGCDPTTFEENLTENLSNVFLGEKIPLDIVRVDSGEILVQANRKITKSMLRRMAKNHENIDIDPSPIRNKIREIISIVARKHGKSF